MKIHPEFKMETFHLLPDDVTARHIPTENAEISPRNTPYVH